MLFYNEKHTMYVVSSTRHGEIQYLISHTVSIKNSEVGILKISVLSIMPNIKTYTILRKILSI